MRIRPLPSLLLALAAASVPASATAAEVTGVVSGPGGPLAGVTVSLSNGGPALPTSTTTGADGSYELTVAPGAYRLTAEAAPGTSGPDMPPAFRVRSDSFALSADRTVDVELPDSRWLTVRVLDYAGTPVADKDVVVPLYRGAATFNGLSFTVESRGNLLLGRYRRGTDASGEAVFRIFENSTPTGDGSVQPGTGAPAVHFTLPPIGGADELVVVRADVVPPIVVCDPPPSGWYTSEVSVACTASDAGSGLADPADAAFVLTTDVGEGYEIAGATTGTREVCDAAGNCATVGPIHPIKVDRAAPQILFTQAADGANGWWADGPATLHVAAIDLNVDALSCTVDGRARRLDLVSDGRTLEADLVVGGEGRHTVACTASDAFGHVAVAEEPVLIDRRAPFRPTLVADRAPDFAGRGGWWADTVTVTTTDAGDRDLADGSAGSGVDPAGVPSPLVVAVSGRHVLSATVRDLAGNESAPGRLVVRVDADPPASELTCPATVALGASASARWSDADAESGLAGRAGGRVALDTASPGTHTATHTALDNVGHAATSSCSYEVVTS